MDLISSAPTPAQAARKVELVRLLRLLALVVVVALVYLAQYIFDHGSLADFYPDWLLALFPVLRRSARWLPADLQVFAQWITAIGLLGFGLVAPMWTGETNRLYRRLRPDGGADTARSWRWAAGVLLVAAVGTAAVEVVALARGSQPPWVWGIWLGSVLACLAAGVARGRAIPGVVYARRYAEQVRPGHQWYGLVFLLLVLALLYTYDLRALPARVDDVSAATGLQVRNVLRGDGTALFGGQRGAPALPGLALALLTTVVGRDGLVGARLAGVIAGLLVVTGIWLVASELFRRIPRQGEFGEVLEDDGRWLTFIAAALAATGVAVYYFARMPVHMEAVALGTLGLWGLLRGLRTDRPWLLALSGLGLGWTWYYGPQALTFLLAALSAWIGVAFLERGWLTGKALAARDAAPTPVQQGAGWAGFVLWVVALLVMIAPLLGLWIGGGDAAVSPLIWRAAHAGATGTSAWEPSVQAGAQLGTSLRLTLLGLNQLPDQSGLVSANSHLLSSLLAPLLMLAVGALLLNMDSLMGWVIVTWLGGSLACAAITAPVHPFWPALLPMLPAVALGLAFVMDRIRVLLMETLGTWTLQATVYLALGVVFAAGMLTWITFYQAAHNDTDLASAVGRAADLSTDRAAGGMQLVVVNGQEHLGSVLALPVVRLLAGDATPAQALQVQAGAWPVSLAAPARMLLAPADVGYIPLVQARYPGGVWQVQRDLYANPVLYVYDLPAEP